LEEIETNNDKIKSNYLIKNKEEINSNNDRYNNLKKKHLSNILKNKPIESNNIN
jgi:hypothetical protein